MPTVLCDSCGSAINVPERKLGSVITCPGCRKTTGTRTIPGPPQTPVLPNPTTASPNVEDRILDKLTNIERMIGLFYRVFVVMLILLAIRMAWEAVLLLSGK